MRVFHGCRYLFGHVEGRPLGPRRKLANEGVRGTPAFVCVCSFRGMSVGHRATASGPRPRSTRPLHKIGGDTCSLRKPCTRDRAWPARHFMTAPGSG